MVEPAPNTFVLDDYVKDVIYAVYAACNTATAHLPDNDSAVANKAIANCEELLGVIMDGKVDDWIS